MEERLDPALLAGLIAGAVGGATLALLIAPSTAYERLRKEIDAAVREGQTAARRQRTELEKTLRR